LRSPKVMERGTTTCPPHLDLLKQAIHKISARNHRFRSIDLELKAKIANAT
jgi:hypothetical protein